MPGSSILTDEDRALLLKVSKMLEEIIETLEIHEDEDTMKAIREARKALKLEELEATMNSWRS